MTASASPPWRRRLSELGRGVGKPHAPLFAPLLYGVAAQVEALPPAEVTADPTRLGKCLVELGHVLGTAVLVVAAPTAMEAEALGASVDRSAWPPRVVGAAPPEALAATELDDLCSRSEALSASLETVRRLAAAGGEPVLLAALTGPARLLEELLERGEQPRAEAYELAGRALASLARQFAQAGASALVLCEREPPLDRSAWAAALSTVGNVARFHRIPALLGFATEDPTDWPAATTPCPSVSGEAAVERPHGMTAAPDLARWPALVGGTGSARVVITAAEVPAETSIESLQAACEAALEIQRQLD